MGGGSWTKSAWDGYSTTRSLGSAKREEIFSQRQIHAKLDPYKMGVRESVDSADNPLSTPIMIFSDVTGSMGSIADSIIRRHCNDLMSKLVEERPVTNPHVLFGAIGDVQTDRAPLQVTQFEADIRIAEQLELVFLEGGGGGNNHESYNLPWYFAAKHTTHDAFLKRGKKGFLFTIGDEPPAMNLSAREIEKVFGQAVEKSFTSEELLQIALERYEVFHILLDQDGHCSCRESRERCVNKWKKLMGERVILCSDVQLLGSTIFNLIKSISDSQSDVNTSVEVDFE